MVDINDYREEKTCTYKGEEYLVRDNGAVLRKARPNQRLRQLDNEWTFGNWNAKTGYFELASVRVHRIVAVAFHGVPPTEEHVVDHIDTNRKNNRPSNLRWLTRFENAVLNPVTRRKIEYKTGVDIFVFLENPSKYRDCFDVPDFSWMRTVTEQEAKECLGKMKGWAESQTTPRSPDQKTTGKLGEWVYQPRTIEYSDEVNNSLNCELSNIIDSLTPLAKQKGWETPTQFVCCPEEIQGDPIACYLGKMSDESMFAINRYGESTIVKYTTVEDNTIVVVVEVPFFKPWALAKITYENGYYLHTNLGTFFTDKGVEKQFVLAQGLEWTGGDSFDDYC